MTQRNRIDEVDAGLLIGASLGFDGVKGGLLLIPFVGPIISWFVIAPVSYLGLGMWFNLQHGVRFTERGVWRFVWYILFGAIPASTTIGTAVTIVGVWVDDARYNAREAHGADVQKREVRGTAPLHRVAPSVDGISGDGQQRSPIS